MGKILTPIFKFMWASLCVVLTYTLFIFQHLSYFIWFFELMPKRWVSITPRLKMSPYQKDLENGYIYIWKHYINYMFGYKHVEKLLYTSAVIVYCTKYEKATYVISALDGTFTILKVGDGDYISDNGYIKINSYENALTYINNMDNCGKLIYHGEVDDGRR